MKTIGIFLIILIFGIYFIYNLRKEENQEEKKFNNYKECIVITSNSIECNDNIIYDINNKYKSNDLIKIEYKNDFMKENIIDIKKIKNYNYSLNGLFDEYYDKALKLLNKMTIDEKIGQVLLARVGDVNQIKDLKTYHLGGYLLFKRDFHNKTKEEVIKMIKSYQDNSNIPLIIASDEEGGIVSRISSNKNLVEEPFKSPRTLYKEGGFDKIKEDTINKNNILSELGINLNLAPVVDIAIQESDYMYKRSLGQSSEITSEFAKLVIETSKSSKVSYTLKHFPGYGNNKDTHVGLSVDTRELEDIKKIDLPPFKAGIDAKAECVLVSHNIVSNIDKDNPSSISKEVHNLLRKDLNFTGIVITDDLSMDAIDKYYKEGAVINAINSGNDLLIVSDYKNSFKEIKEGLKNNLISENIINKRVLRILAFKYYKGLL